MRLATFVAFLAISTTASPVEKRADAFGIDISSHQGSNIKWSTLKSHGISFAYVKATEGRNYVNPYFKNHYDGAKKAGLLHGPFHFARPSASSGSAQASYFISHGGSWSADGHTLPGALDLEGGCAGLTKSAMVSWIKSFSSQYHSSEKRYPVLYITTNWWKSCTGNSAAFGSSHPLWLASWASSMGPLPAGWRSAAIWQYSKETGSTPGDQDRVSGGSAALKKLALGH
ncbi:glycoside hydrolase family 25 protein [Leucogyrophana mollusca]|uniref:Glycoside hydrolase family 25 protein n=1 Tax=Leucogyrophana mollusca TaxID=85980 RepID=A0ACB8BE35_9AGAM|nr:glycoside hydrolase family 25 protein [Leucogyrophana mollusca]